MRTLLLVTVLGALALAGCHRINPRYCDDTTPCAAGAVCGPLNECVAAPDGAADDLMSVDQRGADLQSADLLMTPDLGSSPCAGTCTCRVGNDPGCSCRQTARCELTCADDCHKDLNCRMSSSCDLRCGARCKARCEQASACQMSAGADSELICDQAACTVTCQGACLVRCMMCQSVAVTCATGGPAMSCPGGVQVCARACP